MPSHFITEICILKARVIVNRDFLLIPMCWFVAVPCRVFRFFHLCQVSRKTSKHSSARMLLNCVYELVLLSCCTFKFFQSGCFCKSVPSVVKLTVYKVTLLYIIIINAFCHYSYCIWMCYNAVWWPVTFTLCTIWVLYFFVFMYCYWILLYGVLQLHSKKSITCSCRICICYDYLRRHHVDFVFLVNALSFQQRTISPSSPLPPQITSFIMFLFFQSLRFVGCKQTRNGYCVVEQAVAPKKK